jgi:hypothetical protein
MFAGSSLVRDFGFSVLMVLGRQITGRVSTDFHLSGPARVLEAPVQLLTPVPYGRKP